MPIELKLISALVIAGSAICGGIFAMRISNSDKGAWHLTLGNALAGGIFLGAALIHLLADAQEHMAAVVESEIRWVTMFVGIGFLLVMVPERVMFAGHHQGVGNEGGNQTRIYPYLLAIVLSIHSVIAGLALGLESDKAAFWGVLIAILAHKGSASFALTAVMKQANVPARGLWRTLLLFSIMTPAGILLGALAVKGSEGQSAELFEALFDALAAGTFLYVASMEIINDVFAGNAGNWTKFAVVLVGFGLMALLSVWT